MADARVPDPTLLVERVADSLRRAERYCARLQTLSTRLLVLSIVCSAATTLVAGVTAAQGPIIGEGTPGWRISCMLAAALAFVTAVCVGLNQQLRVGDRLAEGNACCGQLRSLDVGLALARRTDEAATDEYREILRRYPEVTR